MIVIPPVPLAIPDDIIYTNVGADLVPPATPEEEMRYQMFAPLSNQLTTRQINIVVEIKPTQSWNTIMLFNVGADFVEAEILNGPSFSYEEDLRYEEPMGYLINKPNVFILTPNVNPNGYPDATLVVRLKVQPTLNAAGTMPIYRPVHCEFLAVGWRNQIGLTCYGTTLGIMDFSRKDREFDGSITLIERGYADTVAFKFELETSTIADAREFLADLRAKPCGYIGNINEPATYIMGLYRDFTIPIESYTWSQAEIQVESVVRTGTKPVENIGLQAVFVDPEASELICLEEVETRGVFQTLHLDENSELGTQQVRVMVPIGRELLPEETLEWTVVWNDPPEPVGEGEYVDPAEIPAYELVYATNCGEWVATWIWPQFGMAEGLKLLPNIASIGLVFNTASQETLVSNAVTLIVSTDSVPCTPTTVFGAWWNETTQSYDTSHVYGAVFREDLRGEAAKFDDEYYIATYPNVLQEMQERGYQYAIQHYWHDGEPAGYKPNRVFDPTYYKATYPEVPPLLWPNEPTFYYSALEHYQQIGNEEGCSPCSFATLLSLAKSIPVGDFYWTARVGVDQCACNNSTVAWTSEFSGENPPKLEVAGDTVVVCAGLETGKSELLEVSSGVLTLTPSISCSAETEDLPPPATVVLTPITLTITGFISGWLTEVENQIDWALSIPTLSGTWTAVVQGDLTECTTSWSVLWHGNQNAIPTLTVDPVAGTLLVSNATERGIVIAQATVTGRHGSVVLEKIHLRLNWVSTGGDLLSCPNPLWLNGTNTEVGFVEIQEIV